MFNKFLSFNQKLVRNLLIWLCVLITIGLGCFAYNFIKKEKIVIETQIETQTIEKFVSDSVVRIEDLKQGQLVDWEGYLLCVSSIEENNIKIAQIKGIESPPPVSIHLRPNGQCK